MEKIDLVRQLIQAHAYWRAKGLAVELVILNEDVSLYRQTLQDQITALIAPGDEAQMLDKPGGIFVRRRNAPRGAANPRVTLVLSLAKRTIRLDGGSLNEPSVG